MVMCLCLVNYRGSGGFGQESVFSLPGKVGGQEVRDVQVSLKHASQEVSISMGTEFRKEVRIICTCSVFISLVDSCEMFQVDH